MKINSTFQKATWKSSCFKEHQPSKGRLDPLDKVKSEPLQAQSRRQCLQHTGPENCSQKNRKRLGEIFTISLGKQEQKHGYILTGRTTMNRSVILRAGKHREQLDRSYIAGRNVTWNNHFC